MDKGKIIVLNGVSSTGKSTLAKKLTDQLPDFFHAELDSYDQLIGKMEDREIGRLIAVPTERLFHRSVAVLSDEGINLVVDTVLHDEGTLRDFYSILSGYPVLFVGVHCPPAELKRREKARGDRRAGLAFAQLAFVHQQQEPYHVEVDTFHHTSAECAARIIAALRQDEMHLRVT